MRRVPMKHTIFANLEQKMIEHFQAGEYQQALELMEREGRNFPANRAMADYWIMCAAARVGDKARVIAVAETSHRDGLWYGEAMWRMTPSFKSLQGDVDFERLVAKSIELQSADSESVKPVLLEYTPKNPLKDFPLLIALHGNQQSAAKTLPFWSPAIGSGFALVVPQSEQVMFKGAYIWDELETSFRQVQDCFDSVKQWIDFDPKRVVLAGHSMGGLVAIQMAMTGQIPAIGFIANGPALPFEDAPEELDKAIDFSKECGLRAYFIMGEKDVDIDQDAIRSFVEKMKSAGIACELDIVPGVTHDYDPKYDAAFLRALKFMNL